jgi:hypothetical protein
MLLRAKAARVPSATTLETLRIEAGIPRYGIDMDETNVVTESLAEDEAVSYQRVVTSVRKSSRAYTGAVTSPKLIGLIYDDKAQDISTASAAKSDRRTVRKSGALRRKHFRPASTNPSRSPTSNTIISRRIHACMSSLTTRNMLRASPRFRSCAAVGTNKLTTLTKLKPHERAAANQPTATILFRN